MFLNDVYCMPLNDVFCRLPECLMKTEEISSLVEFAIPEPIFIIKQEIGAEISAASHNDDKAAIETSITPAIDVETPRLQQKTVATTSKENKLSKLKTNKANDEEVERKLNEVKRKMEMKRKAVAEQKALEQKQKEKAMQEKKEKEMQDKKDIREKARAISEAIKNRTLPARKKELPSKNMTDPSKKIPQEKTSPKVEPGTSNCSNASANSVYNNLKMGRFQNSGKLKTLVETDEIPAPAYSTGLEYAKRAQVTVKPESKATAFLRIAINAKPGNTGGKNLNVMQAAGAQSTVAPMPPMKSIINPRVQKGAPSVGQVAQTVQFDASKRTQVMVKQENKTSVFPKVAVSGYGGGKGMPAAGYGGGKAMPATGYGGGKVMPSAGYEGGKVMPATGYKGGKVMPAVGEQSTVARMPAMQSIINPRPSLGQVTRVQATPAPQSVLKPRVVSVLKQTIKEEPKTIKEEPKTIKEEPKDEGPEQI